MSLPSRLRTGVQACRRIGHLGSSAYNRSFSSRWKPQRDNDQYADKAIREGMRSRAAYKLEEMNKKFDQFLQPGAFVVDVGAAPGGFSMVAARHIRLDNAINRWDSVSRMADRPPKDITRTLGGLQIPRKYGRVRQKHAHTYIYPRYSSKTKTSARLTDRHWTPDTPCLPHPLSATHPRKLICIDRESMTAIPGAIFIHGDIQDTSTSNQLRRALASHEADVILSDMAPNTTGEKETNHVRIMQLADAALQVAHMCLRNGGTFVCKIFSGAEEQAFRNELRVHFVKVKAVRPAASRKVSPELYYVAQGFVPSHLQATPRERPVRRTKKASDKKASDKKAVASSGDTD